VEIVLAEEIEPAVEIEPAALIELLKWHCCGNLAYCIN